MSILTGPEILRQVELGNIEIDPFNAAAIGPNSINVRLGPKLLVLRDSSLDLTKAPEIIREIDIPADGYWLERGVGYLGHTIERIRTDKYVPWIDGRSTTGRYFLLLHMSAGRADLGWNGSLTLEMMALHKPVRVYAGLEVAQVSFFTVEGKIKPYEGRYQGSVGPRPPKPLQRGKDYA
jgi:dCTP deaminase